MTVEFKLDTQALARLEQNIKRLPGLAEGIINETLHKKAGNLIVEKITPMIRISRYGFKVRNKRHAAESKWSRQTNGNLSVSIVTKGGAANKIGSFGYLVFPNEGRGPHNPMEQRFMEHGLELAEPKIIELVENDLLKKIEEEF